MMPSGQPALLPQLATSFFTSSRLNYLIPLLVLALVAVFLFSFPSTPSPPVYTTKTNTSPVPAPPIFSEPVLTAVDTLGSRPKENFDDVTAAYKQWDADIGCPRFRAKFHDWKDTVNYSAVQSVDDWQCSEAKVRHVHAVVRAGSWFPHYLDGLYQCRCGISCIWTINDVLADRADLVFYESVDPPKTRKQGEPLRATIDLEVTRMPRGYEDIFVGYHASNDVQITYAGKMHRIVHNYNVAHIRRTDVLAYWSSSRCLSYRDATARKFMSLILTHSFGRCENNVGGNDTALSFYPECALKDNPNPEIVHWWDHLHCAMSHYKFVLAIENSWTDSYITEKLYYALDAGSVPIYFGARNVWDFVPPNSIIEANKFKSMEALAAYVKAVANDPVAYAEFHAWRRCGVLGNYGRARAASLDYLPCRLCELSSRKGGKNATATS